MIRVRQKLLLCHSLSRAAVLCFFASIAGWREAVNCLTVAAPPAHYSLLRSHSNGQTDMSEKATTTTSSTSGWKNESARQRWELFHRAIAHAKESNVASMADAESPEPVREPNRPLLRVAK